MKLTSKSKFLTLKERPVSRKINLNGLIKNLLKSINNNYL